MSRFSSCQRCGSCCRKGGPALHGEDLPLVRRGEIALDHLVTIRRGEPVFSPLTNAVEPSAGELIKIGGRGGEWTCCFYEAEVQGCGIYRHRPLECRLLQCWEPTALLAVIYKDCLSRAEVLPAAEGVQELVDLQAEHCAFSDLARLSEEFALQKKAEQLVAMGRMVTLDLRIRQRAVQTLGLSLNQELLAFGRPMFQSLAFYNLTFEEAANGVQVRPRS